MHRFTADVKSVACQLVSELKKGERKGKRNRDRDTITITTTTTTAQRQRKRQRAETHFTAAAAGYLIDGQSLAQFPRNLP